MHETDRRRKVRLQHFDFAAVDSDHWAFEGIEMKTKLAAGARIETSGKTEVKATHTAGVHSLLDQIGAIAVVGETAQHFAVDHG